jgi:hypothetical protein
VTAVIGGRPEIFPDSIRSEQGRSARSAVDEGGFDRLAQIGFGRHIADGIVDEDEVELPPEPRRPHVALDVLALRVQRQADLPHPGRWFNENHHESSLEMRGVVSAAAAKFQEGARRPRAGGSEGIPVKGRFLGVVGRRREERPP